MKTALATCLVLCLFAADLNGQDFTYKQQDSLEGITWFTVDARTPSYSSGSYSGPYEKDRYIKDLVELNLRKYGIRVGEKQSQPNGYAMLRVYCENDRGYWEITLEVSQAVQLINRNIATKKQLAHICTTYDDKAFAESKQEGVEKVLTAFLNNYLAVNQKYRDTQQVQPSPSPAGNQLSPLPSNRRTTEPSKVIQVGGIGG